MRLAFAEALADLADRDARILLLTGDLGYMALDSFLARHPARFFNLGVAEQNMIGVATGLAEGGFIPFCYSIIPFALLRGYEFIRNGPVLHGLPIRIVGVGAGFDYGSNGYTHYATEDLAMARYFPEWQCSRRRIRLRCETVCMRSGTGPDQPISGSVGMTGCGCRASTAASAGTMWKSVERAAMW